MTKARNLADLLDSNGDVKTLGLDNVPPSNDASALTTGTLSVDRIADGAIGNAKIASGVDASKLTTGTIPAARIADGSIAAGKLDTVYQTSLTAGTDYQTPLTAGTDYLAPNGDGSGLSGIASDKLSKELPIASGASITTNDALSISAAGTVGEYPFVNNLDGSAISGSVGTVTYGDNSGTRWLYISVSGGETGSYTMYGAAYDKSAGTYTKGSNVTWTRPTGSGGWNGNPSHDYTAVPLTNTGKFIVFSGSSQIWANTGDSYIRSRTTLRLMLITVNSNGSITIHQTQDFDSGSGGQTNGYSTKRAKYWISRKIYIVGYGTNSSAWNIRSLHVNAAETGWTVTDEGSNSQYLTGTSYPTDGPTANGIVLVPNGFTPKLFTVSGTNITADSDASDFSSQLSGTYSSNLRLGVLPNAQRLFGRYQASTGDIRIFTASYDDDGAVTVIDDQIVPSTELAWNANNNTIYFVSDTQVAAYVNGRFNTLELNSDGTIKGYGITNYNDANTNRVGVASDGSEVIFISNNYANVQNMTINGWSTDSFKLAGFANANASSGNVSIAIAGIQGGFTGLTKGKNYFISTDYDGSIVPEGSTEAGSLVGCAVSATEILIAGVQA